jgi:hypothetical protein
MCNVPDAQEVRPLRYKRRSNDTGGSNLFNRVKYLYRVEQ